MVRTETVLFFSSQPPGSKCSTSVERHGATPSKQKEKCYFDACLKAWMNNDQRWSTCVYLQWSSATKTPRWLAILVVNCSYCTRIDLVAVSIPEGLYCSICSCFVMGLLMTWKLLLRCIALHARSCSLLHLYITCTGEQKSSKEPAKIRPSDCEQSLSPNIKFLNTAPKMNRSNCKPGFRQGNLDHNTKYLRGNNFLSQSRPQSSRFLNQHSMLHLSHQFGIPKSLATYASKVSPDPRQGDRVGCVGSWLHRACTLEHWDQSGQAAQNHDCHGILHQK